MANTLLQIYHHLPAPARSVAASLRGLYLRSWRYGPDSERLVAEALERESWPLDKWKSYQEERLAHVLHRAATRVPYYREQWAERRRHGDHASWENLENWPILTKEPVRSNSLAFVADDCNVQQMLHEHTSGTSGTPLDLWWSKETTQTWYAIFEARLRRWNGVSRHERWAILGGQAVVPANVQRPPFWVWNVFMNQLYLSANHLSQRNAVAYKDALKSNGITHMIAYSSSAALLGRYLAENNEQLGLKVVITNAEPLFPWQRAIMLNSLTERVRETYGMAEIVAAASECPAGKLHLWPEVGWLEVFDEMQDTPVSNGMPGRLICTGLLNTDMPLIRYQVGDRAKGTPTQESCKCGRTLPIMPGIEGRNNDLLITADGRRIYWVNPVFYDQPVREAQIIQETLDTFRILYVPAPDFSKQAERAIVERFQTRVGKVQVIFERVERVPRAANGKFRAVISNLSPEQREATS